MRRKDREVTDKNEIISILNKCKVCRLGFCDEGKPYVVPVNFGYIYENSILTLFIHSAKSGRKIDIINKNNSVCVEFDCNHNLTKGKTPCAYGYNYSSIIADGKAEILIDANEKIKALEIFMKHQTNENFEITSAMAASVGIIKITAKNFSCKKRDV